MGSTDVMTVVMAAGASTRMKSRRSKLLHFALGKTLAQRAFLQARCISDRVLFVVGHQAEELQKHLVTAFDKQNIEFCLQDPPAGTGDALKKALSKISQMENLPKNLFVMGGDSVLLRKETIEDLLKVHQERAAVMSLVTCQWPHPSAYGRIVRDKAGNVEKIVEFKNATPSEKSVSEINAGFYIFDYAALTEAIPKITKNELTGEFYLTDLVEYFYKKGQLILSHLVEDFRECLGVNNSKELSEAQKILNNRNIDRWMSEGVFFQSPETTWIEDEVNLQADVHLGAGAILEGKCRVESGAVIEAYCVVKDSNIGRDAHIKSFSCIENADIGSKCQVGPYARIRPGSLLEENVKIGNFVEIKKSHFRLGSKANHLSYIGDTEVGAQSNIGAGTITCNYDGFSKHNTNIGKNVFIGSNSSLVAPVKIGDGSMVGAGSVITKDVDSNSLAVERAEQRSIPGAALKFRERRAHKGEKK